MKISLLDILFYIQIDCFSREVKTVFLTNDLSREVMAEAVEKKADLILSYHPPLFRPFKRITTGWKVTQRCFSLC